MTLPIEILKVLNIRNNPTGITLSQTCTDPFTSPQNVCLGLKIIVKLMNYSREKRFWRMQTL